MKPDPSAKSDLQPDPDPDSYGFCWALRGAPLMHPAAPADPAVEWKKASLLEYPLSRDDDSQRRLSPPTWDFCDMGSRVRGHRMVRHYVPHEFVIQE